MQKVKLRALKKVNAQFMFTLKTVFIKQLTLK